MKLRLAGQPSQPGGRESSRRQHRHRPPQHPPPILSWTTPTLAVRRTAAAADRMKYLCTNPTMNELPVDARKVTGPRYRRFFIAPLFISTSWRPPLRHCTPHSALPAFLASHPGPSHDWLGFLIDVYSFFCSFPSLHTSPSLDRKEPPRPS